MTVVEARVWLVSPMVTPAPGWRAGSEGSEGSDWRGREILRCAQDDSGGRMTVVVRRDDRAVLPAVLRSTWAHARLRLMGIWADKSGLEMRYATFGYALLVANAMRRCAR